MTKQLGSLREVCNDPENYKTAADAEVVGVKDVETGRIRYKYAKKRHGMLDRFDKKITKKGSKYYGMTYREMFEKNREKNIKKYSKDNCKRNKEKGFFSRSGDKLRKAYSLRHQESVKDQAKEASKSCPPGRKKTQAKRTVSTERKVEIECGTGKKKKATATPVPKKVVVKTPAAKVVSACQGVKPKKNCKSPCLWKKRGEQEFCSAVPQPRTPGKAPKKKTPTSRKKKTPTPRKKVEPKKKVEPVVKEEEEEEEVVPVVAVNQKKPRKSPAVASECKGKKPNKTHCKDPCLIKQREETKFCSKVRSPTDNIWDYFTKTKKISGAKCAGKDKVFVKCNTCGKEMVYCGRDGPGNLRTHNKNIHNIDSSKSPSTPKKAGSTPKKARSTPKKGGSAPKKNAKATPKKGNNKTVLSGIDKKNIVSGKRNKK